MDVKQAIKFCIERVDIIIENLKDVKEIGVDSIIKYLEEFKINISKLNKLEKIRVDTSSIDRDLYYVVKRNEKLGEYVSELLKKNIFETEEFNFLLIKEKNTLRVFLIKLKDVLFDFFKKTMNRDGVILRYDYYKEFDNDGCIEFNSILKDFLIYYKKMCKSGCNKKRGFDFYLSIEDLKNFIKESLKKDTIDKKTFMSLIKKVINSRNKFKLRKLCPKEKVEYFNKILKLLEEIKNNLYDKEISLSLDVETLMKSISPLMPLNEKVDFEDEYFDEEEEKKRINYYYEEESEDENFFY